MINKRTFLFFILNIYVFLGLTQNTSPKLINSVEKVGSIEFNSKTDNPNFILCDEKNVMEYYQVNSVYEEGFNSIREHFAPLKEIQFNSDSDGLLTFRFMVNCKGKIDRIRNYGVGLDYKNKTFSQEVINQIHYKVENMKDWTMKPNKERIFDFYKIISFKVRDGKIIQVIP